MCQGAHTLCNLKPTLCTHDRYHNFESQIVELGYIVLLVLGSMLVLGVCISVELVTRVFDPNRNSCKKIGSLIL